MPRFNKGTILKKSHPHLRHQYLRITAGPQRNMYVHILVAQAKLGRVLLPEETVDHIDGNTLNNSWQNIEVVTRSENVSRMNARLAMAASA